MNGNFEVKFLSFKDIIPPFDNKCCVYMWEPKRYLRKIHMCDCFIQYNQPSLSESTSTSMQKFLAYDVYFTGRDMVMYFDDMVLKRFPRRSEMSKRHGRLCMVIYHAWLAGWNKPIRQPNSPTAQYSQTTQ